MAKTTAAATSPSTPAAPSTGSRRLVVRPRGRVYTATQVAVVTQVELPGGVVVTAHPDWWIVGEGPRACAVVPPSHFIAQYEPADEVALRLSPDECRAIEAVVGLGACKDAGSLLAGTNRLARIGIGGIDLTFTPGQMEELKHRAEKNGHTVKQEMQRVVDRIKDDIFWGAPVATS